MSKWQYWQKWTFDFKSLYLGSPWAYRNLSILFRILWESSFICHLTWVSTLNYSCTMGKNVKGKDIQVRSINWPVAKNAPQNFLVFFGLTSLVLHNTNNKKNPETCFSVFLRKFIFSKNIWIFDCLQFIGHWAFKYYTKTNETCF